MTDRELMQQALDALEDVGGEWGFTSQRTLPKRMNAIEALRARLAQPEQEPVAWKDRTYGNLHHHDFGNSIPLYTAPPQREWQGLTDEEIDDEYFDNWSISRMRDFARAIEAKLKEKNSA